MGLLKRKLHFSMPTLFRATMPLSLNRFIPLFLSLGLGLLREPKKRLNFFKNYFQTMGSWKNVFLCPAPILLKRPSWKFKLTPSGRLLLLGFITSPLKKRFLTKTGMAYKTNRRLYRRTKIPFENPFKKPYKSLRIPFKILLNNRISLLKRLRRIVHPEDSTPSHTYC